ncbi:MAG: hydroxyethylthiazole kinase [archaeon]
MIQAGKILSRVREQKPLIHHITNWVSIYDCANVTRAFGALPIMSHAIEEVEEMVSLSNALVLNIGTLTRELIDSMILAGKKANELRKPIVLDAVGAGATKLRTEETERIMKEVRIDIVKGNKSEIAVLAGVNAVTKGVEAGEVKEDLIEIGKKIFNERKSIAVITGKEDLVIGRRVFSVNNGHELMGRVVGTGCMAASIIASFAAVEEEKEIAAASGLSCFGIAAELAAVNAAGIGSFKEKMYDEIFNLKEEKVNEMQKIKEVNP